MKKLIIKTAFFVVPFFILYFFNLFMYKNEDGDLARLGYFYSNPLPKKVVDQKYSLKKKYTLLSKIDLNKISQFDILNIGDSFSEQDSLNYSNFLAHKNLNILHIDRFISHENPIYNLINLTNSDFFNQVKVKYVVLQCAERMFVKRTLDLKYIHKLTLDSLKDKIKNHKVLNENKQINFFSDALLKIPLTNMEFNFKSKPYYSSIYKANSINNNLFSKNLNFLFFYEDEIDYLKHNNDSLKVFNSNESINKLNSMLAKKNIKLILLIAPDKYDLYYKYIQDKEAFKKPMFYDYFKPLKKEYIFISSFEKLSEKVNSTKDVYYYDDTHWSPIAAKTIADEIFKVIKK